MKYRIVVACFVLLCLSLAPVKANLLLRDEVVSFIRNMATEHDYDADKLNGVFAKVRISEKVISAISKPAEALPWHRYRSIFIKPERIRGGVKFWRQNKTQLERAARLYGVQAEIIVAIIGVETKYGRIKGSYKVIDSLFNSCV